MSRHPKISNNILETIGHTPLVRLNRLPSPGAAAAGLGSSSSGGATTAKLASVPAAMH